MFILSIGMATSLISLCFSIIGIRSRSQLLLEENFFHCSGLLIFRLNLTQHSKNSDFHIDLRPRELKLEFDQNIFHTKHLCEVTAKLVYK